MVATTMAALHKLYIVDGSYYIYRAYYALRGLSNSKGFPTNALYGFVGMLRKLVDDEQPSHLIVTFDGGGTSFRRDVFPDYKATRSPTPDDLVDQLPFFRDIVRAYRMPVIERRNWEADDVIGTLTARAVDEGFHVVLVTGDKDLTQLVSDRVRLLDTMRDKWTGPNQVEERYQVRPDQMADVLGLMGDSSDNIPGVPGVGEKTAGRLIARYESIEGVYEHIEEQKGKLKERLVEHRESAFLSRHLATINTELDIPFQADKARLEKPDLEALVTLFRDLEFDRHLEDLEKRYGQLPGDEAPDVPEAEIHDKSYRSITSRADLERVLDRVRQAGRCALRAELASGDPMRAEVVGVCLAYEPHAGVYVPIAHRAGGAEDQLDAQAALPLLRAVLEDPAIEKVGHDTKRDWIALRRLGIEMRGIAFDTMLASYVLDPSRRSHTLDALAWELLGHETTKYTDIAGRGAKQKTFDFIEVETATHYAAEDADIIQLLGRAMAPMLEQNDELGRLHDELELPLSHVLARMEQRGVLVDRARLDRLSVEFSERAAEIEEAIYDSAGTRFTINSPKQLSKILFEDLELPVLKRTKTGASTDHSVLEQLADEHPLPSLILDYRSLTKLKSTYTDTLPGLIHPETGRIHTEFGQAVAATGRLSSNNPNLQNIPVRTPEGRRIREAFVAPPGRTLVSADYSQVELRLLAHMSGDSVLLDAFRRGEDIHARTARELFDVGPDGISKGQRSVAKSINFGILYGMGVMRLSRELNIPRKEANALLKRYRERIAGVRDFLDDLVARATREGYARTLLGRRRPLPELKSRNRGQRALGERLAVNTPIQGTAADIIKLAMVRIQKRLDGRDFGAEMLLQVHDELVFEVDDDRVEALTQMVQAEMEGAMALDVPLSVDVGVGQSWAEL